MLRLLIDQNVDHDILRGLIRRVPQLDAVTAFDIGMSRASDPELLIWAQLEARIVVTHDRTTMPMHAGEMMNQGKDCAGLFVVPRSVALLHVLDDLDLMITCSENDEWINVIRYLPL